MTTATPTAAPTPADPAATPLAQLEALCDPGSFRPLRSGVSSLRLGERAAPGDGVVAGAGEVEGRPVFCYSQDPKFLGGSLGEVHADTIVRLLGMAGDAGAPVVGFVRSGGARLQEGHAALAGYGRIFRASVALSRKVPQVSIVSGISAGGGAYSPALTDFVAMTAESRMFLTGPKVVLEAMGEDISMEDLGGPKLHGRSGVANLLAADVEDAVAQTRHLLGLLPQAIGEPPAPVEPLGPDGRDPGLTVPAEQRKVYDVRDVARSILDQDSFLEISPRWAPNMVTGIARLEGRSVGLIANQPRAMGGVIDAAASEKAALFVSSCDRFRLPLLVFVDTPGFMPGKQAGGDGGDPPWRLAAARLRRRHRAEGDAGPAQGLRRRRDHDELERPRRRRRLLLARRPDRDHGRAPGGRHRPPPDAEGGRRRLARRARRRLRRRAPDRARRPPPAAGSTR